MTTVAHGLITRIISGILSEKGLPAPHIDFQMFTTDVHFTVPGGNDNTRKIDLAGNALRRYFPGKVNVISDSPDRSQPTPANGLQGKALHRITIKLSGSAEDLVEAIPPAIKARLERSPPGSSAREA